MVNPKGDDELIARLGRAVAGRWAQYRLMPKTKSWPTPMKWSLVLRGLTFGKPSLHFWKGHAGIPENKKTPLTIPRFFYTVLIAASECFSLYLIGVKFLSF